MYGDKNSPIIDIKSSQPYQVFLLANRLRRLKNIQQENFLNIKESLCLNLIPGSRLNTKKIRLKLRKLEKALQSKSLAKDEEISIRYEDIKSSMKLLDDIDETRKKIQRMKEIMENLKKIKININSVFLTFKYRIQRDVFYSILPSSRIQSWMKLYSVYKIGSRRVFVGQPPSPINIKWEHLAKNLFSKISRRAISWSLFTLCFIIRKSLWLI